MKKRILSLLLVLVMLAGMIPAGVITASAESNYSVWVGGVGMNDGDYLAVGATTTQTTKPSGGYAYYKDGVLTLNNYSYEGEGYKYDSRDYYATVYANQNLTVELVGTNSLKQTENASEAIFIGDSDSLTFNGIGSLNATGTANGIYATGTLTFNGSVSLNATGTDDGIYSHDTLTVNGGTIVSTGGLGGIYCHLHDIKINGGNVTASGKYGGLWSLYGYVEILGGNVTATSIEQAIKYSTGFTVAEGMNIQASTTADGALGEYVAANHDTYKKIVVHPAHIHQNNLTPVTKLSATCTEDGYKAHYKCSCGKYFEDASASVEIPDIAAWKAGDGKIAAGHAYGTLVEEVPAKHTATELKAGMEAHYHCGRCGTYFTEEKVATTQTELIIPTPSHNYDDRYGYIGDDGHADLCACGAQDAVKPHTPDIPAPTETQDQKCSACGHLIAPKLGHIHENHLTKVEANPASCTDDGNIEYYECSCGKYFEDDSASVEITDKESVVIKACHNYGELIQEEPAVHTAAEQKDGMKAHYFCDECDTYFTADKIETTKDALVIANTHSYITEWKSDKDNHWNECACGDKANSTAHNDENSDGKCDVCEYDVGLPTNPDNPQTGDNSNMILWIALLFVSGLGVVATVVGKKKFSVK